MANADDPLADYMNAMGLQGLIGANPYAMQGPLSLPGYVGAPTNVATGQPISSYQGILNGLNAQSAPSAPSAPGTTLNSTAGAPNMPGDLMYGLNPGGSGPGPAFGGSASNGVAVPQQPVNPTPAAAAPSSAANSRQAYLQALANPGPVQQYGAVMQPGATPTGAPQPSVLQAFLAAHPGGGTTAGPGGYSNQSFFNTLNNLQAAKGASA